MSRKRKNKQIMKTFLIGFLLFIIAIGGYKTATTLDKKEKVIQLQEVVINEQQKQINICIKKERIYKQQDSINKERIKILNDCCDKGVNYVQMCQKYH